MLSLVWIVLLTGTVAGGICEIIHRIDPDAVAVLVWIDTLGIVGGASLWVWLNLDFLRSSDNADN